MNLNDIPKRNCYYCRHLNRKSIKNKDGMIKGSCTCPNQNGIGGWIYNIDTEYNYKTCSYFSCRLPKFIQKLRDNHE